MIIIQQTVVTPVPEPTLPAYTRRAGLTVLLTGADRSTWDLTNGPVRLQPGVTGLLPPDIEHRWSESPLLDGVTHRGYRVPALEVALPLFWAASGDPLAARDLHASLMRALAPHRVCTLLVVTPDGVARSLPVVFAGLGNPETGRDFLVMGHLALVARFTAPDPHWAGASVASTFEPVTPLDFFNPGPDTSADPVLFNLMPDNATGSASIGNDGDVPVWPTYAVTGPVVGFRVGVGAGTVDGGAVAAGATVWVNTHPSRQTVGFSRDGNNETAWAALTARTFAPIPAGERVPITVDLTNPGTGARVLVELTPRFRHPVGSPA